MCVCVRACVRVCVCVDACGLEGEEIQTFSSPKAGGIK